MSLPQRCFSSQCHGVEVFRAHTPGAALILLGDKAWPWCTLPWVLPPSLPDCPFSPSPSVGQIVLLSLTSLLRALSHSPATLHPDGSHRPLLEKTPWLLANPAAHCPPDRLVCSLTYFCQCLPPALLCLPLLLFCYRFVSDSQPLCSSDKFTACWTP